MKVSVFLAVLLSVIACNAACGADSTGDGQIVAALFPEQLHTESDETRRALLEQSDFVSLELGGHRRLVAAYTNGFSGAVLLIDPAGAGRAVASLLPNGMGGTGVSVTRHQLVPGVPDEVVVSFDSAQGDELDWIVAVTAESLRLIGPYRNHGPVQIPDIVNARYVDFDGDGVSEIINGPHPVVSDGAETYEGEVLRFRSDGSASATTFAYYGQFFRGKGKPQSQTEVFEAAAGNATLVVSNGVSDASPSTSGWVKLNGAIRSRSFGFQEGKGRNASPGHA